MKAWRRFSRWASEPVCPRYDGWIVTLAFVAAVVRIMAWAVGA